MAPGTEGTIHFKLDTANLAGKFQGAIVVFLNDPALPQAPLAFEGTIVPAVELSPTPAFYVAGLRGRGGQAAIEIVNHESEPLQIERIENPTERFTTQLETLEPGQHYRLTLNLKPDGPGGRSTDNILIATSSKRAPTLKVAANTYLFERVRTFLDVVDFGTVRANDPGRTPQTLMIYQADGSDFQVKVSTDAPALLLKSERGPKGDRYQVTVSLIGNALKAVRSMVPLLSKPAIPNFQNLRCLYRDGFLNAERPPACFNKQSRALWAPRGLVRREGPRR